VIAMWSTGIEQRALVEILLVAVVGGVVGTHVLLRRLSFLTMSVSHVGFPGVVIAVWIGVAPVLGAVAAALVVVSLIGLAGRRASNRLGVATDSSVIGVILAGSLALGALLQSAQTNPPRDLASILVGSVVAVTHADLVVTACLAAVVVGVAVVLRDPIVQSSFDPTAAAAAGYGPMMKVVVEAMTALTVVLCVPALGTILAPAMVIVPAMTARLWVDRVGATMLLAVVVGVACGAGGLGVSTQWDVAAGPAITLLAASVFAMSLAVAPFGALRA
jgi:ABC-type Mn2+/Zn2+ transport system permease subunit